MAGNLYQLKTAARPTQFVTIDGPYDRYGVVLDLRPNGYHLIRGLGMERPAKAKILHATESRK